MKTVAIVQARMGSSRLPGKVLVRIAGKPMLFRVIERVSAAQRVGKVVVATTTAHEDDVLVARLLEEGCCEVFRGSINDVLERFYGCAEKYSADVVIRVTADDPLKDPQIIDHAINMIASNPDLDYCSNTIEPTYPEGLDIEVIRFSALARAHYEAQLPSEREHVTPYIWQHAELFRTCNFRYERNLSDWRWTVDKPEDLDFMEIVFKHFDGQPLVRYQDVIAWLDDHPQIRQVNAKTIRNEGYIKSAQMENQ